MVTETEKKTSLGRIGLPTEVASRAPLLLQMQVAISAELIFQLMVAVSEFNGTNI